MELKAGYKNTEVGIIPDDWEIDALEKFWTVTDCKHITAKFIPDGYPLASITEVQSLYVNLNSAMQTTKEYYLKLIEGNRKPSSGDLIFSRNATVGEVAQVADWHPPFAMGQDVCLLRKRKENYSTVYLQTLIKSPIIRKQLENLMVGSTFKRVNIEQIRNFYIPFPPYKEQAIIGHALSGVDALLSGLEKLIAKKRNIKQGTMQQLLKPKEGWEVKKLGEIAEIYTGKKNNQDKVENGQYPFFVRSQSVERINTYSFDGEAILIPGEGNIGKIFHYINGKFDYHQRVYKISDFKSGYNGKYIFRYMSEYFGRHALENSVKATVDSLRLPTFQVFEIPFPPTPEEQTRIATVLSDVDAEIAALEVKLEKYRKVKLGMMQNLLTGKIRLI